MKGLNMLFQMRYGSLSSFKKWLRTVSKCRGTCRWSAQLKEPKINTFDVVLKVLNLFYFGKNMGQMLNLDHLETRKSTFKKICFSRPEKPQLEKGLFESKQNNTTLWVNKKQGVPEPYWLSLGHSSELSKLSYLIWKRDGWAICWFKNFEFCPTNWTD